VSAVEHNRDFMLEASKATLAAANRARRKLRRAGQRPPWLARAPKFDARPWTPCAADSTWVASLAATPRRDPSQQFRRVFEKEFHDRAPASARRRPSGKRSVKIQQWIRHTVILGLQHGDALFRFNFFNDSVQGWRETIVPRPCLGWLDHHHLCAPTTSAVLG